MSEYTKPCTTCKQQIRMTNNSGKWLPQNLDGSRHVCLPSDRYTPKQEPMVIENQVPKKDMVSIPRELYDTLIKVAKAAIALEIAKAGPINEK